MHATRQFGQDAHFLVLLIGRDQHLHRLADGFVGPVAEDRLRGGVPARDAAVQGLADDGVVRRLDDRRQAARRHGGAKVPAQVAQNHRHAAHGAVARARGGGLDFELHARAVAGHGYQVVRFLDRDLALDQHVHHVAQGQRRVTALAHEDVPQGRPQRVALRPAQQPCRHGIDAGHPAVAVGGDEAGMYAGQRDRQALLDLDQACHRAQAPFHLAGQGMHEPLQGSIAFLDQAHVGDGDEEADDLAIDDIRRVVRQQMSQQSIGPGDGALEGLRHTAQHGVHMGFVGGEELRAQHIAHRGTDDVARLDASFRRCGWQSGSVDRGPNTPSRSGPDWPAAAHSAPRRDRHWYSSSLLPEPTCCASSSARDRRRRICTAAFKIKIW